MAQEQQTLAAMVRAKYPGVYDDLSDDDLDAKVRAKFPGVYDDLPKPIAKTATPPPVTSTGGLDPRLQQDVTDAADRREGIKQGALQTFVGLGELTHKLPLVSFLTDKAFGLPSGSSQRSFGEARQALQPRNANQAAGQAIERTAEFFAPTGVTNKIKAGVKTGTRLLDTLFGAGIEGASAGAVGAAQSGSPSTGVKTGLAAGTTAAAIPAAASGARWLGERIERSLIKAGKADVEAGFNISNIFKHKLGGTLSESFDKSTERLNGLSNELRTQLRLYGPTGKLPDIDIMQALTDTATELGGSQARNFGSNTGIQSAIQKLMDDPWFQSAAQNGKADLVTANEIKQAIGELGSWQYGMRDPDSLAMEKVANTLYSKLRKMIETASPGGPSRIKALNQAMGEIVPIRQAIIRRIPVEQRQNVLNLGDLIGVGTGNLGLSLANRLLRSGRTANAAVGLSDVLPGAAGPSAKIAGTLASMTLGPNGEQ